MATVGINCAAAKAAIEACVAAASVSIAASGSDRWEVNKGDGSKGYGFYVQLSWVHPPVPQKNK